MSARRDIICPRYSSNHLSPRLLAPSPHTHLYLGRFRLSALTDVGGSRAYRLVCQFAHPFRSHSPRLIDTGNGAASCLLSLFAWSSYFDSSWFPGAVVSRCVVVVVLPRACPCGAFRVRTPWYKRSPHPSFHRPFLVPPACLPHRHMLINHGASGRVGSAAASRPSTRLPARSVASCHHSPRLIDMMSGETGGASIACLCSRSRSHRGDMDG